MGRNGQPVRHHRQPGTDPTHNHVGIQFGVLSVGVNLLPHPNPRIRRKSMVSGTRNFVNDKFVNLAMMQYAACSPRN